MNRAERRAARKTIAERERAVLLLQEWESLRALEHPTPKEQQREAHLGRMLSAWCARHPLPADLIADELANPRTADEIAAGLAATKADLLGAPALARSTAPTS